MAGIRFRSIVIDTTDVPRLAAFYRDLLEWRYSDDQEPEPGTDWHVVVSPDGLRLAFQQAEEVAPTTWPSTEVPQQMHLDLSCEDRAELDRHHERALALGAELRLDSSDDPEEPLRVYADPAGHLFCLFTPMRLPSVVE